MSAVNNFRSFEHLDSWRNRFLTDGAPCDPGHFPFVVVGNKTDEERVVSTNNLRHWCRAKGDIPLFETSAKDPMNVEAVFQTAARIALLYHKEHSFPETEPSLPLETSPRKEDEVPDNKKESQDTRSSMVWWSWIWSYLKRILVWLLLSTESMFVKKETLLVVSTE